MCYDRFMPTYSYTCMNCDTNTDKIVAIKDRDDQMCVDCGYRMQRGIDLPGLVWAPTAGGMR